MNRTWRVDETEVGNITLSVSDGDEYIYIHVGYQHHPPEQLRNDLEALARGDDPRSWDGNELIVANRIINRGRELPLGKLKPEERLCNQAKLNIKSKVICNQDGPVVENMGSVGKKIFAV